MSRDENYSPFKPEPAKPVAQPGELLYEFVKDHTRIRCELIDRGPYGVEARITHNEEHHAVAFRAVRTPRAAPIHRATEKADD